MVVRDKFAEKTGHSWNWGKSSLRKPEETEDEFEEYDPDDDPRRKEWEIV